MVSDATAFVWCSSGSVDTVLYFEPAPDDPTDSGFSLLRVDAPRLGPRPDTPVETICIHLCAGRAACP